MKRYKLWRVPLRLAAGAFILNSGLSKVGIEQDAVAQYHGFASGAYPMFKDWQPKQFVQALSTGEIALGSALLAPFVPSRLAGLLLSGFSSGLLGLYLKTPGMREEGGLKPTEQGISLAKDSWLLAMGLALILGGGAKSRRESDRE